MGIIDRVTQWLRPQARAQTTSDEQYVGGSYEVSDIGALFKAEQDRIAIVKACRDMYKTDTRAKRIHGTLARDAVKGGFTVHVQNNPQAETEAVALVKRLNLNTRLDDWARLTFRDGDSMLEVGVTAEREIAKVTRKPTLQMHRNSNPADEFSDPQKAFWYASSSWTLPTPPAEAIWFAQWQIVHARWDHDEGSQYGSPLFASGTDAFKRVKEGERDIAVRRKTRAGLKYLHVQEGASETDLQAYRERNKDALNNPLAAIADFFSNKKGALDVVQGDARLQEIGDVRHHIQTWLIAGIVPMELFGYGEDLNRDVLGEKKAQYERELDTVTAWVETEMVKPLLELQWLLKGFYPETLEYEIKWASKQTLTAAVLRDVADAVLKLRGLGYGDEVINTVLEMFLPGIDLRLLMAQSPSTDAQGRPARPDSAKRIANVADAEDEEDEDEED